MMQLYRAGHLGRQTLECWGNTFISTFRMHIGRCGEIQYIFKENKESC